MRVAHRLALFLFALAGLFQPAVAVAQTAPDIPPVISPLRVQSDVNGVNLVTGKIILSGPSLSVPAAPNLRFDRVQNAAPYLTGTINAGGDGGTASYAIHTGGGSSEAFTCSGIDCHSVTGSGSTLTARHMRQAGSGAVYAFSLRASDRVGPPRKLTYYASSVSYPNGEVISYQYDTYALDAATTLYRPKRLTSSLGYYITIAYQSDDGAANAWQVAREAALYSAADPAQPLGRLTYSGSTITDLANRTFTCVGCWNALGANLEGIEGSLTLPAEGAAAEQVVRHPTANVVSSIVKDGVAWSYAYANLRLDPSAMNWLYDSVTVSGPNGYNLTYRMHMVTDSVGTLDAPTTPAHQHNELVSVTDALSRMTSYHFDGGSRPDRIVLPELNEMHVDYDVWGNVFQKTVVGKPGSGLQATETAHVDEDNCALTGAPVRCYRPIWTLDALSRQTDYVYNDAGQLTEKTEPADKAGVRRKTFIEYENSSGLSRPSVVRVCGDISTCGTPDEVRTEYSYWGGTLLPLTETRLDARAGVSLATTYSYDAAGRPLSVDGPLPGTDDAVFYRYDLLGRRTWEIGPKGANGLRPAKRTYYRDSDDKVFAVEAGTVPDETSQTLTLLTRSDIAYDSRRNPVREAVTAGGAVQALVERSFDDRGLIACQAQRMNTARFAEVTDACALAQAGADGPDRITHNVYDDAGQLTTVQKAYRITAANGFTPALQQDYATYDYTPNGKQRSVTDANGNRAEMRWDGLDRQSMWIFPSPTVPGRSNPPVNGVGGDYEQYGYDIVGNRTSLRKRDGVVIASSYDGMNRLTQKDVPGSVSGAAAYSVFYGYDVRGLQTYARFGSDTGPGIATAYDGLGRPVTGSSTMDGTARTLGSVYDAGSRRTGLSGAFGYSAGFSWDAAGQPLGTLEAGYATSTIAYDAAGRRQSLGLGFGAATSSATYLYDAIGRLQTFGHDLAGGDFDQSTTFGYNAASQITSEARTNGAYAASAAYDVSRDYRVNGLNQYSEAGPQGAMAAFGYDANGNLTSTQAAGGATTAYLYDAENRLVQATTSGGTGATATVSLAYDPAGRLWQVSAPTGTTRFLYDGDRLAAEYDGAGTLLRAYTHGAGADEPLIWYEVVPSGVSRRFLHADHQGSIVAVADQAGNKVAINGYDAWGIPNATNQGRFGYTGQVWIPELGLWYYKARFYSATLGRFLQTDPIGYKDQVNLYAYVGNDPADGRDPSGMAGQCDTGSRLGGASGGCMVVEGFRASNQDGARQGPGYAHTASPATDRLVRTVMSDPQVRAATNKGWDDSRGQKGAASEKNEYGFWVRPENGHYNPGVSIKGEGPQIFLPDILAARRPGDFIFVHLHPFRIGDVWRGKRIDSIGISDSDRGVALQTRSIVVSVARPEPFTGRGFWVDSTDDFRGIPK